MSEQTRRAFLRGTVVTGIAVVGGTSSVSGSFARSETDQAGPPVTSVSAVNIGRTAADAFQQLADMAMVRVVHASPDAPNVDVYVDGTKVLSDVPFGTISNYLSLPPGEHTLKITAAGDPSTVVFEGTVSFKAMAYTVAAIGELSEGTFTPLLLTDGAGELAADTARVRVVHASPDAPPVTVTVKGTDLTLFENLPFGEASDYVDVPAGEYTLEIRNATTADSENDCLGDVVTEVDVSVMGGMTYSAFALGYVTPDDEPASVPFSIKVAVDTPQK